MKISVLDVGCGTGRYFYALENVDWLVGVDVSPFMLMEAKNPVQSELVTAKQIDLVCGNIFDLIFPPASFDFVYSIGVLGEHSPFDDCVCDKLYRLLKPGGSLFFTVVDQTSMRISMKRKLAETLYPVLPHSLKKILDDRKDTFYMPRKQLEKIMIRSNFVSFRNSRRVSSSPTWQGAHFECLAMK